MATSFGLHPAIHGRSKTIAQLAKALHFQLGSFVSGLFGTYFSKYY